ncbi:hypothetical protein Vafri_18921 [Volvox africanus]|uniref:Uncharacterized protein n=1 Tax=Volvox africanus TaxID=51714 RepID=A0A8J4BTK0_9CHLO|nr:hypothetical protein Vafri_18921 [Volvox africanus]
MSAAHRRLQCRRAREASGLSKLIRGLTAGNRKQTAGKDSSGSSSSITGSSISSSSSSISSSSSSISSSSSMNGSGCSAASDSRSACSGANVMGPMSQEQLAEALQGRIGFRLELGPSSVPHPEAGTGVFIRGEARPGSVVAIFPGVLYGRTQLAHMPNFPKVDTNNPYLSCRYDQSIVDSKPWGPGDPGTSASSGSCAISHLPTSISGIRAADGSSSSSSSSSISFIRDSTASASCWGDSCSTSWWTWAGPLSSALGQLEGRHPLALGHFVNHPGAGGVG